LRFYVVDSASSGHQYCLIRSQAKDVLTKTDLEDHGRIIVTLRNPDRLFSVHHSEGRYQLGIHGFAGSASNDSSTYRWTTLGPRLHRDRKLGYDLYAASTDESTETRFLSKLREKVAAPLLVTPFGGEIKKGKISWKGKSDIPDIPKMKYAPDFAMKLFYNEKAAECLLIANANTLSVIYPVSQMLMCLPIDYLDTLVPDHQKAAPPPTKATYRPFSSLPFAIYRNHLLMFAISESIVSVLSDESNEIRAVWYTQIPPRSCLYDSMTENGKKVLSITTGEIMKLDVNLPFFVHTGLSIQPMQL
jgi:hypothetical protein